MWKTSLSVVAKHFTDFPGLRLSADTNCPRSAIAATFSISSGEKAKLYSSQKAAKSSDKDDFGIDTSSLDACLDDAGSSLQPDADKNTVNVSDTVSSDSQKSSIEVLDTQSSFDNPLENDSSVCSSLAHFEALARISSDPLNAQIQDQNEKNDEGHKPA